MRSPFSLILLFLAAGLIFTMVQIGALTIAFGKLGLSRESALLLLASSLLGSLINLRLFRIQAQAASPDDAPPALRPLLSAAMKRFDGHTTIALNVGGALIPISFSFYLLQHHPLPLSDVMLAVFIVALVCYRFSRPIPGLGIGMPIFIAPLAAALTALFINTEMSAPLAYICGTLGVLIGADLMRTNDIRKMGVPVASIGGAGTFDGIFLTGLIAVLLA